MSYFYVLVLYIITNCIVLQLDPNIKFIMITNSYNLYIKAYEILNIWAFNHLFPLHPRQ